jgi:uncharacterized protein YhfF
MMAMPDDISKAEFAFPGPLRDRLVEAIMNGTKSATTSILVEYSIGDEPLPAVGAMQAVVDSDDAVVAIIETLGVDIVRLADVGIGHARDEGEGHDSVASWRSGHEAFWHSVEFREFACDPNFTVNDDTLVVMERFRVIQKLGS